MREVWRQAHLEQPLGSRDGSHTRQDSAAAVASSRPREAPEAAPPAWRAPGGSYIKLQVSDPIIKVAETKKPAKSSDGGKYTDEKHLIRDQR